MDFIQKSISYLLFKVDKGALFIGLIVLISLIEWIRLFINKDDTIDGIRTRKYVLDKKQSIDQHLREISSMESREFEKFCNCLLSKLGYKTKLTSETNDYGRDIIIFDSDNNESVYVECKRYTSNASVTEKFMIGREICEKLVGSMVANGIDKGIIITTGNIHQNAIEYIERLSMHSNIRLEIWDMGKIEDKLRIIYDFDKIEEQNKRMKTLPN